jgi:GNAT superfamily N-acetyltransferase
MTPRPAVQDVVDELARDPLRHIVLLKQLLAYPEHVRVHRVSGLEGAATLVLLNASVSPYDRQTYPRAAVAAFISSDHPKLTASLMPKVPRGAGVVFKLSRDADLAPVQAHFAIERRTAFQSFTSAGPFAPDPGVRITTRPPGDAVFQLFEAQGHDRAWLEPLLRNERALTCVLARDGDPLSACLAFENFGRVWEVGGVVTAPPHRRQGLATRVVRTALAALTERGLAPRYQVEMHNEASIGLARAVGLAPFLTITHYAHEC